MRQYFGLTLVFCLFGEIFAFAQPSLVNAQAELRTHDGNERARGSYEGDAGVRRRGRLPSSGNMSGSEDSNWSEVPYPIPYPSPYPYPYPGTPSGSTGDPQNLPASGAPRSKSDWPLWYYCSAPDGFYPYVKACSRGWKGLPVMPPPPGAKAPISEGDWQYCGSPVGFFPYISSCQRPWLSIPPTIPMPGAGSENAVSAAQWFYCREPSGYFPYIARCKDWLLTPAVPPPALIAEDFSPTSR